MTSTPENDFPKTTIDRIGLARRASRFAEWRQLDRLLGGKVETQMPSRKVLYGARRYNRMAARGAVFISKAWRMPRD
jgi:hypothetical protein